MIARTARIRPSLLGDGRGRHRWHARARSFTLTELLVVMSIITIMATAVLVMTYEVLDDAKEARTKTQIAKLNQLVMERWESYRTRVMPVLLPLGISARPEPYLDANRNGQWDPGEALPPSYDLNNNGMYDVGAARVRLAAMRDLMRMELPERIGDLVDPPRPIIVQGNPSGSNHVTVTMPAPSLWWSYRRRAGIARTQTTPPVNWSRDYQFSECLYMIVASIRDGERSGLDYFKESEIGDVDNDGFREILDAWGQPIMFLRWAPGFTFTWGADAQWGVSGNILERGALSSDDELVSDLQTADAKKSPDPFDPLQVDGRWWADGVLGNEPFALMPLIFSAGRDGRYELWDPEPPVFQYALVGNDPYRVFTDAKRNKQVQIGMPYDGDDDGQLGSVDNITNHLIEAR